MSESGEWNSTHHSATHLNGNAPVEALPFGDRHSDECMTRWDR